MFEGFDKTLKIEFGSGMGFFIIGGAISILNVIAGFAVMMLGTITMLHTVWDYEKVPADETGLRIVQESEFAVLGGGYRRAWKPLGVYVLYPKRIQEFDYENIKLMSARSDEHGSVVIIADLATYFFYPREEDRIDGTDMPLLKEYFINFGGPEDIEDVRERVRQEIITIARTGVGRMHWQRVYTNQAELERIINGIVQERISADGEVEVEQPNQLRLDFGEEEEPEAEQEDQNLLGLLGRCLKNISIRLTRIRIPEEIVNAMPKREAAVLKKAADIVAAEAEACRIEIQADAQSERLRELSTRINRHKDGVQIASVILGLDTLKEIGTGENNTFFSTIDPRSIVENFTDSEKNVLERIAKRVGNEKLLEALENLT